MLVLVAIPIGLAALLAVPLEVAFQLERVEALRGHLTIRWLLGLVRVRIAIPRPRPAAAAPAAGEGAARGRPRRGARARPARLLAALRQASFRRRVLRLAAALVRAVHVGRLRLTLRLGLGDPADTGWLWALLGPLGAVLAGLRGAEVRLEPELIDPVLQLWVRGRVRVVPLRVVAVAGAFALSPASIRAWRALRAGPP